MFKGAARDIDELSGVILAGGKGTRLRSVVSDRPKVLAEIQGRPFLTYLLDQLISARITRVVLCTGFMADDVYKKIGETYRTLRVVHSKETVPLGTAGALRNALTHLRSKALLVMNGDSFIDIDLNVYLKWFYGRDRQTSLLLTKVEDTSRYGRITINEDDSIRSFEEKGNYAGEGLINAGIYILKEGLLKSIPPNTFHSLEREFFPQMIGSGIYGYTFNGRFIDIGTPESYLDAEIFFAGKNTSTNFTE